MMIKQTANLAPSSGGEEVRRNQVKVLQKCGEKLFKFLLPFPQGVKPQVEEMLERNEEIYLKNIWTQCYGKTGCNYGGMWTTSQNLAKTLYY